MRILRNLKRNLAYPELPDCTPPLALRIIKFCWALFICLSVGLVISECEFIYAIVTCWGKMDIWVRPVAALLFLGNTGLLVPLAMYWFGGDE